MLPVGFWFLASPVGYSNRSCCHSGRVVLELGSTVFLYSALEMLFLSGRCWWLCFFVWHCGVCFGCPLSSLLLLDPAGGGWGRVQPPTPTFLCCHFCFRSFLCSCLREHAPPWGWVVKTVAEALSYGVAGLLRGNCFRKRGGGFFCAPRPEEAGGRQRPPLRSNGPRWAAPSTCSNARTIRSSNVLMPPHISVLNMFLAPNDIRDGRF